MRGVCVRENSMMCHLVKTINKITVNEKRLIASLLPSLPFSISHLVKLKPKVIMTYQGHMGLHAHTRSMTNYIRIQIQIHRCMHPLLSQYIFSQEIRKAQTSQLIRSNRHTIDIAKYWFIPFVLLLLVKWETNEANAVCV